MRIVIIASSLVLSACTTTPNQASAQLKGSLDELVGQPVDAAIARLGDPVASAPAGSDLIYSWGYGFTRSEFTGAAPGWVEAANSQGGVFPAPRRTVQDSCVITMVVGANRVIREWNFQGHDRGCKAYADRLVSPAVARTI